MRPYRTTEAQRARSATYRELHRDRLAAEARERRAADRVALAPIRALLKSAALVALEASRQARKDARRQRKLEADREREARELGEFLAKLRRRLEPRESRGPRVRTAAEKARATETQRARRRAVRDAFIGPMALSRRKLVEWYREHPEQKPQDKRQFNCGLRGPTQSPEIPGLARPREPRLSAWVADKARRSLGLPVKATRPPKLTPEERASIRSKAKADRMAAKALAAKAFRKEFMGPPKPKGYRAPRKPRTEAQEAATAKRLQGIAARQDAVAAYRREVLRPAEVRRVPEVPVASSAPRPVVDLDAIAAIQQQALERRRALQATTHTPPITTP